LTFAEVLCHYRVQTPCHDAGKDFVLGGEQGNRVETVRLGVAIGLWEAFHNSVFLLGGDLVVNKHLVQQILLVKFYYIPILGIEFQTNSVSRL
jgi:hypothetical protein